MYSTPNLQKFTKPLCLKCIDDTVPADLSITWPITKNHYYLILGTDQLENFTGKKVNIYNIISDNGRLRQYRIERFK